MKAHVLFGLVLSVAVPVSGDVPTLKYLSSRLFTNATIVWQAPTGDLPKSFWVYHRNLPRIFSATVISNAVVLGSLQSKGFPKPSTNTTCIEAEPPCPCLNVCNFFINPGEASMSYESPNYKDGSPDSIPADSAIAKRAWECASQLGLDPKQLVQKSLFTHTYYIDRTGKETTNFICGRGIFLSRRLDGVAFFSADDSGSDTEGFSLELGRYGQIRFFSLRWSDIARGESQRTASPEQIVQCIKLHVAIVLPAIDEQNYFAQLRALANARKLTITRITPYYSEYVFGEVPTNNVPCKFVTPLAELEAVADLGDSNTTVRLVSPILSSKADRLLGRQ